MSDQPSTPSKSIKNKKPPGMGLKLDNIAPKTGIGGVGLKEGEEEYVNPTDSNPKINVAPTSATTTNNNNSNNNNNLNSASSNSSNLSTPPNSADKKSLTPSSDSTPGSASTSFNYDGVVINKTGFQGEIKWEDLKIMKNVGSGASANVKKVKHTPTGTKWALKIMQTDNDQIKPKTIVAEVKTLYESTCPYIVTMKEAWYRDGCISLLLEFMDYGSLQDLVNKYVINKQKQIPEEILSNIAAQSLKGLAYLHGEKKIMHRDIKPANILLNSKGEVKLTDFGMAGKAAHTLAQMETFQGTLTYMSPERIQGLPYSFDSDIWGIGLSLAQCALGRFPYKCIPKNTDSTGFFDLLDEILKQDKLELPDAMSQEFKEFIWSCMNKNPMQRLTAKHLLDHPFIKKYEGKVDLGAWLKKHLPRKKKKDIEKNK